MSKPVNFFLGISFALVMILFSTIPVYASSASFDFPINTFDGIPFAVTTDSNDGIFIAAPFNTNIHKYDSGGNFIETIDTSTNPAIFPSAISVDSTGRIIVTDILNLKVHILGSNGSRLSEISHPFTNPIDVTTDSSDRIIVVDQGTKNTYVFGSNGVLIDTIPALDSTYVPTGVATDSNNRIIIADDGNDKIHIYDSNGNWQFTIDEATPGTPFVEPYRVATDSQNRIIVIDSTSIPGSGKHGVFIYDSECNFLHSILDPPLSIGWLSGVTSDSTDRIIVTDRSRDFLNVFNMQYTEPAIKNSCIYSAASDSCNSDCTPPDLEFIEFNKSSNWLSANNPTFKIGDKQVIKFRYSDNRGIDNIRQVELGFGLPTNYSPMWKAETILKINTDSEVIKSFKIEDDNNLFVKNSITLKVDKVNCISDICSELEYTLEFIWDERPFDGYFLITGADYRGNISFDRSAHEFKVIGETQYEQPALEIYNRYTSTTTDELFIQLTRIDKILDIWIDEKDRKWHHLGNDRFELIT